jgi:hypothetical protein
VKRASIAVTAIAVATLAAVSTWAQTPPPPIPALPPESGSLAAIPSALIAETLTVAINATVGKKAGPPTWESKELKYTIPGSSVSVKMIGTDVAILITVTPYKTKDGGLLLLAQGQVWYKEGDNGLRYRTTVDTLPVHFGERVLFYPFGIQADGESPLRVELVMDKYKP